ncbi:MAG: hypothetical protein M5U34_17355 [Chloroflexi bacterium]|nr:hypothetical protein [Chloroflexota bacterium]
MGVHTRLTDEVEEWKIQRTLQLVREMGAPGLWNSFPGLTYHGEDGGFAWNHLDMVIRHAQAQGLTVIARLGLTPEWARPPDTPLTYLDAESYPILPPMPPPSPAVTRARWIISSSAMNSNLSYEWGLSAHHPRRLCRPVKVVYPAVKKPIQICK